MRCNDCNKFVATEVEIESAPDNVSLEKKCLAFHILVEKKCENCGNTLSEANVEVEVPLDKIQWEDA